MEDHGGVYGTLLWKRSLVSKDISARVRLISFRSASRRGQLDLSEISLTRSSAVWRRSRRPMPLRALSCWVSPGDVGLIALPLVLPWYPAADEAQATSLLSPVDVGRLKAVCRAMGETVFYHIVWFKA